MIRTIARTISIPTYLYKVLERMAQAEARSFSNMIVALVLEAIDERARKIEPRDIKEEEKLF